MSIRRWGRSTTVYTMTDAAGAVLYIGVSVCWPTRVGSHAGQAPWWAHVRQVDLEHHATRREALEAEAAAIHLYQPPFNVDHTERGSCPVKFACCSVGEAPVKGAESA